MARNLNATAKRRQLVVRRNLEMAFTYAGSNWPSLLLESMESEPISASCCPEYSVSVVDLSSQVENEVVTLSQTPPGSFSIRHLHYCSLLQL